MLDKYGKCPTCETDWDGGDIKEVLSRLQTLGEKTEQEIIELATSFGWTPTNPIRFTKLISIHRDTGQKYWKCPKCNDRYDQITGEKIDRDVILKEEAERFSMLKKFEPETRDKATF